jgi:hypothetical protein
LQFVQDGEIKSVKCFHKSNYGERFVLLYVVLRQRTQ